MIQIIYDKNYDNSNICFMFNTLSLSIMFISQKLFYILFSHYIDSKDLKFFV